LHASCDCILVDALRQKLRDGITLFIPLVLCFFNSM
jgi:hypothetical protein